MKNLRYTKVVAAILLVMCMILPSIAVTEEAPSAEKSYFTVSLDSLTDQELESIAAAVAAEQRARIKTKVVLDKNSITLAVGKADKITGNVKELPAGEKTPKLEWSTSDKSIVTVKNGQVKAVSGGTATVTCGTTLSDGTHIYAECRITVNVPITSITADRKKVDLSAGSTFTPKFTFKPKNASETRLTFVSSNPAAATVNEKGVITGVAAGKATITAKAVDGSGKSVDITVNVKNNGYLKNTKGKDLFNAVLSGERASNQFEGGESDWYDRAADIGGFSFEVHSLGENGQVVGVEVLDIMNTRKTDIFFKVLEKLFSGEDLQKATNWLKKNIGKNTQTQIGDAYIFLQQSTVKAPIMYIMDEEHKDWV